MSTRMSAAPQPWRINRMWLLPVVVLLVLAPSPAWAHGIGGDAADRSVLGFVPLGIEHMLLGWDHILFIGGVVLLAGEWRRAAKLITVFVVGHSLTLITATLAGWQVNATLVDVVIVLSVVFVGGYGMVGRPRRWAFFGGIVFLFGLVHGLGLATRFQALGVPEDGMLWRVVAFNVGIEIGQLTAIIGVLAVAAVVSMLVGREREPVLRKGAHAALFGVGTIAAPLLAYQGFSAVDLTAAAPGDYTPPAGSDCSVGERTERFGAANGGHTGKTFYDPDEETPLGDFGHSLLDGYVLVLYPPDLPAQEVSDLRDYVVGHDQQGVLAGPHPDDAEKIEALTFEQRLTCESFDLPVLRDFSDTWITAVTHGA